MLCVDKEGEITSLLPFHDFFGTGFSNRSSPTGASAYGMFRYFRTIFPFTVAFSVAPRIFPAFVVTTIVKDLYVI